MWCHKIVNDTNQLVSGDQLRFGPFLENIGTSVKECKDFSRIGKFHTPFVVLETTICTFECGLRSD